MHSALAAATIIILVWRGDWRDWRKYHPTMLYFALGNLLYNFLTANHFLWRLDADFLSNHTLTEMLYTFCVFPITALIFLTHYPTTDAKAKLIHYLRWIFLYVGMEYIFWMFGRIQYQYGWNLMWSAIFDITMFPMLRLHSRKPMLAYAISLVMCVAWIWMFNVPVNVPVEDRK